MTDTTYSTKLQFRNVSGMHQGPLQPIESIAPNLFEQFTKDANDASPPLILPHLHVLRQGHISSFSLLHPLLLFFPLLPAHIRFSRSSSFQWPIASSFFSFILLVDI